jgi:long-subunit fatty acid transport protein
MNTLRAAFIYLILSGSLFAQTAQEAIELIENENGFGVKAAAMGNAFTAMADDYSAIYWNPAGLAQMETGQISGSLMHTNFSNDATYLNTLSSDTRNFTKFQSIGLAYPFPVIQGAFVIAFGYQKINNPDAFTEFNAVNFQDSVIYPFRETYSIYHEGEIENWSFAAAMDLSPNFSAGVTFNFIGGSKLSTLDWMDDDFENIFSYSYFERSLNTVFDYSGFNIQLGGLFHLTNDLKLGASMTFPHSITVDEEWSVDEYDAWDEVSDSIYDESGTWDYLISMPFKFSVGLAYSHPVFTVGASMDYRDWSQLKYEVPSNRSSSEYSDLLNENNVLRDEYRSVISYSLGGEFNVLNSGLFIRGGYQYKPNPKNKLFDKKYYSVGLGYVLDKRTSLDFSYTQGQWSKETEYVPPDPNYEYISNITTEEITTQTFMFGLKYNF